MSKISFEEVGAVVATFHAANGVKAGAVVKLTGNATVGPCSDGNAFCGVALGSEDGCAAVQVKGFMTVSTSGAIAVGPATVAANGQGGIKSASGGTAVQVISYDAGASKCVICL